MVCWFRSRSCDSRSREGVTACVRESCLSCGGVPCGASPASACLGYISRSAAAERLRALALWARWFYVLIDANTFWQNLQLAGSPDSPADFRKSSKNLPVRKRMCLTKSCLCSRKNPDLTQLFRMACRREGSFFPLDF